MSCFAGLFSLNDELPLAREPPALSSHRHKGRRADRTRRVGACEHTFLTAQPHAHVRFRRAIERRALWLAEDAARELPNLSLADALQLVHLYAERGSPKFEPAARRWLVRYLTRARRVCATSRRSPPALRAPDLALDDVVNLEDLGVRREPDSDVGEDWH